MFTTGSKLLIGSAVAAAVFAVVYGITAEGTLGTIGLTSAAIALAFLAGINMFVRDSNVAADDPTATASSAAAQATTRRSIWPFLVALGATAVALGIVTTEAVFVLGVVAMLAGGAEWLVESWSERASSDPDYNDQARDVMADPLELPIAAAIGGAVIIYSFSRIMLGLPTKTATVAAFSVVAGLVVIVGAILSSKSNVSKGTLIGVFSLLGIALIAGGAVAGLNGERDIHPHHTAGDIAEENDCGPSATEADERASQTVAAKSSIAAELSYDGSLGAAVAGYDGDVTSLTLPRSNPNNVIFVNDSSEEVRLVIELHPELDADGVPLGPERLCTALVEEGGQQLLTVVFDRPSYAVEEGYAFVVPGTDESLEVIVP